MNPFPLLPLELDHVPPGLLLALAQEGVPTCPRGERPEGRFVLFDGRLGLDRAPAAWQVPIDIDPIRRGCLEDPFDALLDQRSARVRWEVTGLGLTERIARVDRRQVRRRIIDRLRERVEQAGGAWLNLAPYPFPYRCAIGFRIDHDRYHDEDLRNTLAAVDSHAGAVSHYLNGAAYEPHDQVLRQLDGRDVGSHGYLHRVHRSEAENYENVSRGLDVLRRAGLTPSGFAAPGGQYNRGLAAALERLGVGHSSEIHLAYDDWPFWPAGSSVLQMPVHPVSLGLFLANVRGEGVRRAAAAQQAVRAAVDYFRQTARAKYRAGEPAFFHGALSGRLGHYPQLLRAVFDTADGFSAVWPTTLTNFAKWWRARAQVRIRVEMQGEQYVVRAEGITRRWPVAIEYWRGPRAARIPLSEPVTRFATGAVAYENRARGPSIQPVRIDGPHGLGHHMRRWFAWERDASKGESEPSRWRDWAARTLRALGR